MKNYHFAQQKASNECPAVPKAVTVASAVPSLADATKRLAEVLREDPKLEKEHPELMDPEFAKKEEKPQNRRK